MMPMTDKTWINTKITLDPRSTLGMGLAKQ